ncbi:hypothetical protein JOS77_22760 [Chromobacterium haemolyticum]|nr:hypothetical protein JOS77_22760 [Chromobacterium haemolyticum]
MHHAGIGFSLAGQHAEQAALAAAVMAQQADAVAQFYSKGKVLEQRAVAGVQLQGLRGNQGCHALALVSLGRESPCQQERWRQHESRKRLGE